ncbi:MAG TPA: nuclear transport factor 2 family protein, partial [Usitatibacteraceae bacterium]|nr:nuclear transport factor 2 family protein [Usitatibacteraceae bacterium]
YAQLASRAYDRALQLDKNNTTAQVKLAMVKDLFVSPKTAAAARRDPEKVASAGQARAEPPKVETAKVESAKVKPGKVEPAKVESAKPAPAAIVPAADDKGDVGAAIEAWARAWSTKDVKAYLAAYAPDFETPRGEARDAWEKQRTERIQRPKSIEVTVKIQSITIGGGSATAVLRQSYRSDALKTTSTKTLKLAKVGGKWLIKQERVGG